MVIKKCGYFISLKTGAFITAFCHIVAGIAIFAASLIKIIHFPHRLEIEGDVGKSFLITYMGLGIMNVFMGILLVLAILHAQENYILLYLLLGIVDSLIVGIYSAINLYYDFALLPLIILSIFLWYVILCMYGYYMEIREYNTTKSGAIEVAYNTGQFNHNLPSTDKLQEITFSAPRAKKLQRKN